MSLQLLRERTLDYLGEATFSTLGTQIDFLINLALQQLSEEYPWDDTLEMRYIRTFAPYSTGNVDVTLNSRDVDPGTSAPGFTYEMVGGEILFQGDATYYEIIEFVPGATAATDKLVIDPPYFSATGTDQTYEITKSRYALPLDTGHIFVGRFRENDDVVIPTHPVIEDMIDPNRINAGDPTTMRIAGMTKRDLFNDGTVAVTINTNTAVWTPGSLATGDMEATFVGKSFRVVGDPTSYTIYNINTATDTLTLDRPYRSTTNATAEFVIQPEGSPELSLENFIPGEAFTMDYRQSRIHPWLIHNDDEVLFRQNMWQVIYALVKWKVMEEEQNPVAQIQQARTRYNAYLKNAVAKNSILRQNYMAPLPVKVSTSLGLGSGRFGGRTTLFPSGFGRVIR